MADFKLEKGNKATDWTPAPEDVEVSIETAKTHAETLVNNLEIGGRNLLSSSAEIYTGITYFPGYGKGGIKIDNGYEIDNYGGFGVAVDLESSAKYVISFDIEATGDISGSNTIFRLIYNREQISLINKRSGRYSFIFTSDAQKPTTEYIGWTWVDFTTNHKMRVTNVKLEKGNKATDWTPAPEDVQYDYEAKIKNAADSISLAVYNKTLDELNPATELKLTSSSIKLTVAGDIAAAKSEAISAAATDATTKANNAKDQAISVAATDATNKVNGLKTDLAGTGIDIEEGILTLYSGAKGGNTGGKIIIAGDNFSVDADGKLKAVDGEFSGKITANEGTLGALTMQSGGYIDLPPSFTNRKGRLDNTGLSLIYDGSNSQKIYWYSGLGTFAGEITCNSQGRLRLSSSFGIEMSVSGYSPISITDSGSHHYVDFGSAEVVDIRKLSSIGQLNMAYTTHTLSADTWYHISTDVALIIITSAGSGSVGIYRITGPDNSTPSNGDIKIITNATDRTVYLKTTKPSGATYNSNIKVPNYDGNDFNLHENSSIMLVYYGGYWRVQTDKGQ